MKFNCNKILSKEELDRHLEKKIKLLKVEAETMVEASWEYALQMRQWHKKFLWLPFTIKDYDCRWLEYIEIRYPNARGLGKWVRYGDISNVQPWTIKCNEYPYTQNTKFYIEWGNHHIILGKPEYRSIS